MDPAAIAAVEAERDRIELHHARERVSIISDALSIQTTIAIFDEKQGAVNFRRCARDVTQAATNAGENFKVAPPSRMR